ncbi:hypothetical protein DPMN_016358 [Dreissena polymorpha]|uniref:Uncharacterized protein n=1 Tax=Dreissena polymorpha TaxID=45954 RepID=A0A9D4S6H2_DREPO|nr:hypothetical protein DPMN_016358 [Dreissena polymorpha]
MEDLYGDVLDYQPELGMNCNFIDLYQQQKLYLIPQLVVINLGGKATSQARLIHSFRLSQTSPIHSLRPGPSITRLIHSFKPDSSISQTSLINISYQALIPQLIVINLGGKATSQARLIHSFRLVSSISQTSPIHISDQAPYRDTLKNENTDTREHYLVGWETREAFLNFPTSVLPLDHRTTNSGTHK